MISPIRSRRRRSRSSSSRYPLRELDRLARGIHHLRCQLDRRLRRLDRGLSDRSRLSGVPGGDDRREGGNDSEAELDPDHGDTSEPSQPTAMRRTNSTPSSGVIGRGGGSTFDRA